MTYTKRMERHRNLVDGCSNPYLERSYRSVVVEVGRPFGPLVGEARRSMVRGHLGPSVLFCVERG